MNVLKTILNILLAFLLLVSLTLAGLAITINATVLNAGFINRQIDTFDVSAFFEEEIRPELQREPDLADRPEVISSIGEAVVHNSPALKGALKKIVLDAYGFVVSNQPLDLRLTLKNSLFAPSLASSIVNDVDLTPFIHDLLLDALPSTLMEVAGIQVDLVPYADDVIAAIQPWFKEQVNLIIPSFYEYILGYSSSLESDISVGGVAGNIGAALKSAILASPPPDLVGLTPAQISQAFDVAWKPFPAQFPTTFSFDVSELGFARPAEIDQALGDARNALTDARQWVGYYHDALWGLVGLIIVLVAVIAVLNRSVKYTSRVLGITTGLYGVAGLTGYAFMRNIIHGRALLNADIPVSLQEWLLQLMDATLVPMLVFSLICLALGVALILLSVWYRRPLEEVQFPTAD